jgi:hypothetical protein
VQVVISFLEEEVEPEGESHKQETREAQVNVVDQDPVVVGVSLSSEHQVVDSAGEHYFYVRSHNHVKRSPPELRYFIVSLNLRAVVQFVFVTTLGAVVDGELKQGYRNDNKKGAHVTDIKLPELKVLEGII